MAGNEVVLYDAKDGVATITLNRPERLNAWTGQLEVGYFDSLEEAAGDPAVKVIVVTGAGKGFCAGADMDMLQGIGNAGGGGGGGQQARTRSQLFPLSIQKPIIAAINGACAGLGLVHAVMCDIRFAAAGAKFTTAFVRRGLIAEHGVSWLLPRLVGQGVALDLLYSGRVFVAEEAKEIGLVNRVFPAESLLDETLAYARDIAENCSPSSMAVIKRQVYGHLEMGLQESWEQSNGFMAETLRASDFKEGVSSFVEKRPPQFAPFSQRLD
jgi:enoyl-CoA hydratase/carnithine racemase